MKKVDIVVPVMNEEEVLPIFYDTLCKIRKGLVDYDIGFVFVDDGSKDSTLSLLKEMSEKDPTVGYVAFSRNFGKEAAIYAGLKNASGDIVILMDGDLEHPPELIPHMLRAVDEEGFQACGAKRQTGFFSRAFANLNNKMSSVKLKKGATDYMCMKREFVDAVLEMSETQRFSKGLFAWVGFDVKWIDYEQPVRPKGKSKWNFHKLFNYAIEGITSFSTAPLRFVTIMGIIICCLAFIYIIITLIKTLITGIDVPGYTTILIFVLFLGGIVVLSIGILGEYIGRTYMESKRRPVYLTKDVKTRSTDVYDVNEDKE